MLQIDLLLEQARGRQSAMRAEAATAGLAGWAAPLRVRLGVMLIRLGRLVVGDPRRIPAWQGYREVTRPAASR